MLTRFNENGLLSEPGGFDGCDNASRSSAVDADVDAVIGLVSGDRLERKQTAADEGENNEAVARHGRNSIFLGERYRVSDLQKTSVFGSVL
tara:strand:+ start:254698 stop:254970 length:273 start_codon:yes stop_codon:yes gene_type:complete